MDIINKRVFVSSYTFIKNNIRTNSSGPVIPLMNYFTSKAKKFYLLEQPLPGCDFIETQLTTFIDNRQDSVEKKNFFVSRLNPEKLSNLKTYIRLKIRDIFSNIYFFKKNYNNFKKEKIDLFIGVESINAIMGIVFKKLGLVDKVVYYIFDWAPDRYANPVMNKIYNWLDKIASYYSDYTWNITYTIGEARVNILKFDPKKLSPQLYVPYGVGLAKDQVLDDDKIDKNLIIFAGTLEKENGPMLALESYKMVMIKYPYSKLLIIGGGNQEEEMKQFIKENKMEKNVQITGYIGDQNEVIRLQCQGAIGIAPYPIIKGSRKPFGDVIKVRMYFACGLVVVSTPVPPVSKEIESEKLGIRTKGDTPEEFAEAIGKLLDNKNLLLECRHNVINKAADGGWEKTYSNALSQMKIKNK